MDVEALLADERERWARLRAVFEQVPSQRFEDPGVTPDGWSPKDLLYHVVAWVNEGVDALDRERSGGTAPEGGEDVDAKNARFFRTSQGMTAKDVRSAIEPARERMIASFTQLDEVTPDAREWFEESGSIHYAEHERDLRGWLEGGP